MDEDLKAGTKIKYHTAIGDFDGVVMKRFMDDKKPFTSAGGKPVYVIAYDDNGHDIEVSCELGTRYGQFSVAE